MIAIYIPLAFFLIGLPFVIISGVRRGLREPLPFEEVEPTETEGPEPDTELLELLHDAFRELSPNSSGRGSIAAWNLSTAIQKLEAGEEVSRDTAVAILSQIKGLEGYIDQIKGVGA